MADVTGPALQPANALRSMVAPHIGKPVEHARGWVTSHRLRY